MSYEAEISRSNPSMFLFLIDQSGSMDEKFAGGSTRKDQAVADAINRLLQNLVIKCAKSDGVRDYYHVGVIGYGAKVGAAFGGELADKPLVPISKIADAPVEIEERTKKVEDGAGGLVDQKVRFPIWFKPLAFGGTPMVEALTQARRIVDDWMRVHPNGFPPIIINITDGESSDGDPVSAAATLRDLHGADGAALLFNVHLSSLGGGTFEFPHSESELPDKFAKQLFQMSSPLPPHLLDVAQKEGYKVSEGARGFVFNADIVAVIKFLDIGTRPSNLR
ncbi:MAG: VWA domain-containing protein [Chloroflexota bacterium]|nr:VWA domain-containing protein [Chloroflexota bacterium]